MLEVVRLVFGKLIRARRWSPTWPCIAMMTAGVAILAQPSPAQAALEADQFGQLLAGKGLPPENAWPAEAARSSTYASYVRRLDRAWERYDERTLKPVATWVERELNVAPELVFYPFSGPDILNALSFFPRGKRYLLVGLERIGGLPDPDTASFPKILAGIRQIRGTLAEILGYNFFRTRDMQVEVGSHPYNGTVGLMLLFLARTGHRITGTRRVAIDADGRIVESPAGRTESGRAASGVEIRFRAPIDQEDRIVYYFRRDLSNREWRHGPPDIDRLLRREPRVTTFLKAASYLMFKHRFSQIRELILDRSDLVLQDASGIPFRCFQTGSWSLRLYGQYQRAYHLFSPFEQPRLRAAMRSSSLGRLPFSFGYNYRPGSSHVIVVARQPETRAETLQADVVR
jgi:hypothetical protein